MSLRDLVAGSDVCTPGDGGGPSNAVGSLANALLGTSKVKDGLQELPSIQEGPSGGILGQGDFSAEGVARAVAHGDMPSIPGLPQAVASKEAFADPCLGFHEFDEIYSQQMQPSRPGINGNDGVIIEESFKTFERCGAAGTPYTPVPLPSIHLSFEDKCHICDRAMAISRQYFARTNPDFAHEQMCRFLDSLGIQPSEMGIMERPSTFDTVWNEQSKTGRSLEEAWQEPSTSSRTAGAWQREYLDGHGEQDWVSEFSSKLHLGGPDAWAADFNAQSEAWVSDFGKEDGAEAATSSAAMATDDKSIEDVTSALIKQMSKDPDPKFRNSKFLQFVHKLSEGEIEIKGNEVIEVQPINRPPPQSADELVDEFAKAGASSWAQEFQDLQASISQQWGDEFGSLEGGWVPENEIEAWVKSYSHANPSKIVDKKYTFADQNPFAGDLEALFKGRQFFGKGVLTEAALAVEAELEKDPENPEAWKLLGVIHAENDDDVQALAAFSRAREFDPSDLEVLRLMAVSHANELDESETVRSLHTWLFNHPEHKESAQKVPPPPDPSQELAQAIRLFQHGAENHPQDSQIFSSLGVLQHMARDYDAAISSFERALEIKPDDYSLWNKLGATMANSGRSAGALQAYQRALDIKPNYMRGWTNLGISHANLGNYDQAAQFYVRALSLHPTEGVWGYLRTSLLCAGKSDLLQFVEAQDLTTLKNHLG